MKIKWLLGLSLFLLILAACGSSTDLDEPPEIRYGEDTCDRCLMIINEARYAAAFVTKDGETLLFDDIGGMALHEQETGLDVSVYWVHDFDTEEWLKGDEAAYVMSMNQQTPMGFGIVAFTSQERAQAWAEENEGMVMTLDQLLAAEIESSRMGGHAG